MANSNLVTREDLKNVFEALGEGSYETRIDTIEGAMQNMAPIYASGTKSVSANAYTDLATIILPPKGKYLVFASTVDGIGTSITAGCFIRHDGTPSMQFGNGYSRITGTSGQGVCAWKYFETGDTSVTVKVSSYGYYATTHNVDGYIIAFQIPSITN